LARTKNNVVMPIRRAQLVCNQHMTIVSRHRNIVALTACSLAVAPVLYVVVASTMYASYAQDRQDAQAIPSEGPAQELSARELELRRKEEELLQVMSGAAPAAATESRDQNTNAPTIEPVRKTIEVETINVAEKAPETERSPLQDNPLRDNLEQLRALEQHPALEAAKPQVPASSSPSNAIRTHQSDGSHDGTTATKLGTYTRVKRPQVESAPVHRETARSKMVPLHEIEQEASIRNVSYSAVEPATIRTPSVRLKTGPTKLDTSLVVLPQYSEVTIDYRSGGWYRVRTESGLRGWVPGTALLFDAGISQRSAVRIGAVNPKTP
jgi:hypothetical protein